MQTKNKKEAKEDEENSHVDLTFCFQSMVIIEEALAKLDYIGNFTYSHSASVMSNSIGQQIEHKMRVQGDLEKKFEELIIEKTGKTELLEEKNIKNLITQIQNCADDLKKSTNDICKSLAENPDIPSNLLKANVDKNLIMSALSNIKGDLIKGTFENFEETINDLVKNSIKIEEKRADEMALFRHLRTLNEELAKEEEDYLKETKNLENRLSNEKKKLAKTKMEEAIFKDYRKAQLEALKVLKKTNFNDAEAKLTKEIDDRVNEKDKISNLDNYVLDYVKDKTQFLNREKQKWENIKGEKETENTHEQQFRVKKIDERKAKIEELKKTVDKYDAEIEKLKNYGISLDSKNIGNFNLTNSFNKDKTIAKDEN